MKVTFLKNHAHYKKGQTVDANEGMANYWLKTKVCKKATAKKTTIKKSPEAKK